MKDDLIGETIIDLEDRLLSPQRAYCGLPETYTTEGPNAWREMDDPITIMRDYCVNNNILLRTSLDGDHQAGEIDPSNISDATGRLPAYVEFCRPNQGWLRFSDLTYSSVG